jgi:hypothetical protein
MLRLFRSRDARLRERVAELEEELAKSRARERILRTEIEALAEVIARDRARVAAETAIAVRQQVAATGGRIDE